MSTARCFVTSDVHLGAIPPSGAGAFHAWLRWAAQRSEVLVINGDLFDFWFEYGSVIPRGYARTLGLLAELVDQGLTIHLLGGNHDWWGGSMLTEEIGVVFHRDPVILDVGGRRCLFAHGDGLGQGDLGYRMLRWTLRSPVTRSLFRWLHPDIGAAVARRVSRTEIRQNAPSLNAGYGEGVAGDRTPPAPSSRGPQLRRWARDQLLADATLHDVFLGHTHDPVRQEVAPGRFYINSGDWLHHYSFVDLPGNGMPPELFHWSGSAPPEPLNARAT